MTGLARLEGQTRAERQRVLVSMTLAERQALAAEIGARERNPYLPYQSDPVGFVTDILHETLWSRQREILESVRDHRRTAVPACHAPGKSHIAARAVAWWVSVHPPGTAQVVTTATTFRQVRNVLWPHIRRLHMRHDLPGEIFTTEWKIGTDIAAYGFSASNQDDAAVQGVHSPHLLVVVDEAGGISSTLGRALESLMTGGHTRLLTIGNPSVDTEASWFERCCASDLYNVIRIGAYDTPNFTGEDPGTCLACPPEVPPHSVGEHLVDQIWVDDVISEFGADSAYVEARVYATFPRQVANKVIPLTWCEEAKENETPAVSDGIRLGVDIAADGGDEFCIAWADGYTVSIRHRSSGQANASPVEVAGIVLQQIREAERTHQERSLVDRVRVKIDSIGVGWGVAGLLDTWGQEGRHGAEIVAVNVSEKAQDAGKFHNQRAEMWWTGRGLLQPASDGSQQVRLDVDDRTLAQLSGPMYKSDSSGRITIEGKMEMRRRGVSSPDRAEAVLLSLYEPPGKRSPRLEIPVSFGQSNQWTM